MESSNQLTEFIKTVNELGLNFSIDYLKKILEKFEYQ